MVEDGAHPSFYLLTKISFEGFPSPEHFKATTFGPFLLFRADSPQLKGELQHNSPRSSALHSQGK